MTAVQQTRSTPGGRTLAEGPKAERSVDENTYAVDLDLNPIARAILTDLSRALRGKGHWFTALANMERGNPEFDRTLDRILAVYGVREIAFTQPLHPEQAERLSSELWDAKDEPSWCDRCHHSYRMAGSNYCPPCDERVL